MINENCFQPYFEVPVELYREFSMSINKTYSQEQAFELNQNEVVIAIYDNDSGLVYCAKRVNLDTDKWTFYIFEDIPSDKRNPPITKSLILNSQEDVQAVLDFLGGKLDVKPVE